MEQQLRKRAGGRDNQRKESSVAPSKRQQGARAPGPTMQLLIGLVAVLVINVFYPMDPAVSISDPISRESSQPDQTPIPVGGVRVVLEDRFSCGDGLFCHAWLVLPNEPLASVSSSQPPVVVMGHGLACMKDMGLYTYAVEFARVGLASYMIDYRGFGLSDGEPRHVVDAAAHAQDFVDAVHHVSRDARLDAARIALWGTSLSGGHVVMAAGQLGDRVKAVISQAPALDAVQSFLFNLRRRGVVSTLRVVFAAVVDTLRGAVSLSPAYIKIFGGKGELAALPLSRSELEQYFAIHSVNQTPPRPYLGGWVNKTPPRTLLTFLLYRPIAYANQIPGPVLYVVPSWDSVVPIEVVDAALPLSPHPRSRKLRVEGGHFQLYRETVGLVLPDMVSFLQEELT